MITKEQELAELLAELLTEEDLERLLTAMPEARRPVWNRSHKTSDKLAVAADLIDHLRLQGAIEPVFFEQLTDYLPTQSARINQVRDRWVPPERSCDPETHLADKPIVPRQHVAILYARPDWLFFEELRVHLMVLQRVQLLEMWTAHDVTGTFDPARLRTVTVLLPLLSNDLLACSSLWTSHIQDILFDPKRKEPDRRRPMGPEYQPAVLPILLRPCLWQLSAIARYRTIATHPEDLLPMSLRSDPELAWISVAQMVAYLTSGWWPESAGTRV